MLLRHPTYQKSLRAICAIIQPNVVIPMVRSVCNRLHVAATRSRMTASVLYLRRVRVGVVVVRLLLPYQFKMVFSESFYHTHV